MNRTLKPKHLIRLAKFFVPLILGLGVFAILGLTLVTIGEENTWMILWPLLIAYFFPPLGKESVIPLGIGVLQKGLTIPFLNLHIDAGQINPLLMALSIAFIDIIVALFLVWNYDLAKRIPLIGKFMIKIEEKGKISGKKYSWVKPLRFIGIMLFVMVPFQGSGGLVGSIVGRLIGMKPWNTFFAISLGAVIGCLLIATFTQAFLIFVEINTTLTLILIGIIAISIVLYFAIKKRKKQEKSTM
ncbi:MAG: small multi-drug export protein [Thermoplasmatales archaeon]|nr:MAG: small multi-drug export protein [Thermoplasmatales archaeon]